MRLPEQRFWDAMRRSLGHKMLLERIENSAAVGTPDVLALARGVVTAVELKAVAAWPARASTPVVGDKKGLSVDQRNWHSTWRAWGGRSAILVRVAAAPYAFDGAQADEVNAYSKQEFLYRATAIGWNDIYLYLGKL